MSQNLYALHRPTALDGAALPGLQAPIFNLPMCDVARTSLQSVLWMQQVIGCLFLRLVSKNRETCVLRVSIYNWMLNFPTGPCHVEECWCNVFPRFSPNPMANGASLPSQELLGLVWVYADSSADSWLKAAAGAVPETASPEMTEKGWTLKSPWFQR